MARLKALELRESDFGSNLDNITRYEKRTDGTRLYILGRN